MARRRALDGSTARARRARRSRCASPDATRSPTSSPARARRCRRRRRPRSRACSATCCATRSIGKRVVPIIPDEARTFGLDALFREVKIYAPFGQPYEPVDAGLLLSYQEAATGRMLEEGITEAGSMASLTAAGTAYATWGQPMIPFFIFYSMFGFQRVGDLIWSLRRPARPRLPARRDRRAHDAHRRGPPALRRPQPRARVDGAELPRVRPGVRVRGRRDHPRRHRADVRRPNPRTSSTTSRSTTRTTRCRRCRTASRTASCAACTGTAPRAASAKHRAQILASGTAMRAALEAQQMPRRRTTTSPPTCGARRATSCCAKTRSSVERWNRLHPTRRRRASRTSPSSSATPTARSSRSPTS